MILDQFKSVLEIIPAYSESSSSYVTHLKCLSAKGYSLQGIGGWYDVCMCICDNLVCQVSTQIL